MATKTEKVTGSLLASLITKLSKSDKDKAEDNARRIVRTAMKSCRAEVEQQEELVEAAKERLENLMEEPTASLAQIIDARRDIVLAEKTYEEMSEIYKERF